MVQYIAAKSSSEDVSVFNTTTTGTVDYAEAITSGIINIANTATRTGTINIGHASGNGAITIDAGASVASLKGDTGIIVDGGSTGNVTIAPLVTSGEVQISCTPTRTGQVIIGHNSSSGDITLDAGSSDIYLKGRSGLNVIRTTTGGSIEIANDITSGTLRLGYSTTRTGNILFGNVNGSGDIDINSGSGNLQLQTAAGGDIILSPDPASTIQIGGNLTTGIIEIGFVSGRTGVIRIGHVGSTGRIYINGGIGNVHIDSLNNFNFTAGGSFNMDGDIINIGNDAARTGAITIGNASASGAVDIDAGSSEIDIKGSSGLIACRTDAGHLKIGENITSGHIEIGYTGGRSGQIRLGIAGSSGRIFINSGTQPTHIDASTIFLTATNFATGTITLGISDSSGNSGTVTSTVTKYDRSRDVITCYIQGNLTSKGSMVAGDAIRITGLPYTAEATYVSNVIEGPMFVGSTAGTFRVKPINGQTYANIFISDYSAGTSQDMLVSDVTTGLFYSSFTYFT